LAEKLRGVVERVTYANAENGYSVLRLAVKGKLDLVTVVGNLADVNAGESLEQHRLAFHDRLGGERADIAETQHCGTV